VNVQTIHRAKQQWQAAVDAMPQLICLLDDNGRVVRANRTLERWGLGSVAQVNGARLHEVLHPGCDDPACYLEGFLAGAKSELASSLRTQREVLDPYLSRHLSIQLQPLLGCPGFEGEPCALALFDDITAHKLLTQDLGTRLERESTRLRHSREELRALSASRLSMLEDERKRIASELHDGLGQALSLIRLALSDAARRLAQGEGAEVAEALKRLVRNVAEAMQEVRRMSAALRPSTLDDLGIIATLCVHCRECAALTPGVAIEQAFRVREEQVPCELKLPIYRIVQEAMHNVVKHAQAKNLHVGLSWADGELRLRVQDDGRGFDPAQARYRDGGIAGMGLLGMEERAALSAGRFELSSSPGQGTCIRVTWNCGGEP
jgi:signal transduction histidine kinase